MSVYNSERTCFGKFSFTKNLKNCKTSEKTAHWPISGSLAAVSLRMSPHEALMSPHRHDFSVGLMFDSDFVALIQAQPWTETVVDS
jgi:hypothetical protein